MFRGNGRLREGWLSVTTHYNNVITTTTLTITTQNNNSQHTNQDIKPSTNGGTINNIRERAIGDKRFFNFGFLGVTLITISASIGHRCLG